MCTGLKFGFNTSNQMQRPQHMCEKSSDRSSLHYDVLLLAHKEPTFFRFSLPHKLDQKLCKRLRLVHIPQKVPQNIDLFDFVELKNIL